MRIGIKFICILVASMPILNAQTYSPGSTYFDSTAYVEYLAGNLPIIISVPHGGYLEPSHIPDRNCSGCSYLRDSYTQEMSRSLAVDIYEETGCYPHVIINLLHRVKFDANRDIGEAADSNVIVEQAWYAYHQFIDSAKAKVIRDYGSGLFLDMHGHAHDTQRVELGYLLSAGELRLSDSLLNTNTYITQSSLQNLVSNNLQSLSHSDLIRGQSSLGEMLEKKGFRAVPSFSDPYPLVGESYFSGGYNTRRHGSHDGGDIDGIQVECNSDIRFDSLTRESFADSLATSISQYITLLYNTKYLGNYCKLLQKNHITSQNTIEIFPNPASDFIHLTISKHFSIFEICLLSHDGRTVKSFRPDTRLLEIENLPEGLYFLCLKGNKSTVTQKILLE